MALRITVSTDGRTAAIRLEGRLQAASVPDLRESCHSAGFPVRLDLSGLQSADEVGIDALRSLRAEGVGLHGVSPHISQLLENETP